MMLSKENLLEAIKGLGGQLSTKRLTFYRTHVVMVVVVLTLTATICWEVLRSHETDIGNNLLYAFMFSVGALTGHSGAGYVFKKEGQPADTGGQTNASK